MSKYCLLLSLLLLSCNYDNLDNTIPGTIILVDSSLSGVKKGLKVKNIIPIETSDSSVFGQFYKLQIDFNGIYVLDRVFTRNLYHFDKKGNFINRIQTGKGPGEVIHTYSTYFDKGSKEIFVYDAGSENIKVFDSQLNYIRTISINTTISYQHFNRLSKNNWLIQAKYKNYPKNDTTALYVILDNSFQEIEQKYIPYSLPFESVSTLDPISTNYQNQILFTGIFDNNLYTIDDKDNLLIKYQVDFGHYNLTEQELQTDDNSTITKLWQEGKRKTYLDRVQETDQYVGFAYLFKDSWEFCIYSKKTGTVMDSEKIMNNNFIPGIFVDLTDDYFVIAAEPSSVIEYLSKGEEGNEQFNDLSITEGDNPILVYYQLDEVL